MREKDIRPKDIFDEYLRLAKKDTKTFFENAELQEIPCPACGLKGKYSFKKNNFLIQNVSNVRHCMLILVPQMNHSKIITRIHLRLSIGPLLFIRKQ